jgi:hypothetical protein
MARIISYLPAIVLPGSAGTGRRMPEESVLPVRIFISIPCVEIVGSIRDSLKPGDTDRGGGRNSSEYLLVLNTFRASGVVTSSLAYQGSKKASARRLDS